VPHIPDSQWAVLEALWERGPATVRQLTEALYPKKAPSDYATVHTLLARLEASGHVTRERGGPAQVFRAARGRDAVVAEVVGEQMEALADRIGGGSLQPLLTNLIRGGRLTAEQLRELRDLVDSLDAKPRRKKDPK
jgi:predicted transcriptional regulator